MAKSRLGLWCAVITMPLLSGCGTAANVVWFHPNEGGQRVYGGVRGMTEYVVRESCDPTPKPMDSHRIGRLIQAMLDIPLSFVGDTITLPYILWFALSSEGDVKPITPSNQLGTNESVDDR